MDKGWNPLPVDFFSHTGALAHGIVPIGEMYPSHAVLWFSSRAREEEEEESRMESAAVLIRSPCDVFIACLGCRQGQVTIGLVLVNGGGCTSGGGWHSCGDFFLSFCWGWGEERRRGVQTIPSYLPLLNRHHGRAGTWSTCIDTSYNGRDPVTNEPDLGLWDGKTGLDPLDR